MKHHFTPNNLTVMKKSEHEKAELSHPAGGSVNSYNHFGEKLAEDNDV